MYVFTLDAKIQELFVQRTQSGSMCLNDTVMQYASKMISRLFTGGGQLLDLFIVELFKINSWCRFFMFCFLFSIDPSLSDAHQYLH